VALFSLIKLSELQESTSADKECPPMVTEIAACERLAGNVLRAHRVGETENTVAVALDVELFVFDMHTFEK